TGRLLKELEIRCQSINPDADLSAYDILVVGKSALTIGGPAPRIGRVRDGLKVIVFEQTSEVLEKRFGFRVEEYGARQVFPRVPGGPRNGAVLPARRDRTHRDRTGCQNTRAESLRVRVGLETSSSSAGHVCRRADGKTSSRSRRHIREFLCGWETVAQPGTRR